MPLMCHIDHPPPRYEEVLERLRPGDVLTHAFRPFPNSPATQQGTVKREVLEARKRGVKFDMDKTESPVCWMAQFRDPDGNKLVVHKRK